MASLSLHGIVVALVIFFTYYAARQRETPPVIFELVAGPPTAPNELVAPALGNSLTPVKTPAEPVEEPAPAPTPPEPKVVETVKTQPEPEAVPTPPKPAKETKPVEKPKPVDKAKETKPVTKAPTSMAKEMKQAQRMSYRDYLKKHPTPKPPPVTSTGGAGTRTAKAPRVDAEGIAQGVRGGSTANKKGGGGGKALTREEQSELNTYISMLISALKEAHEPPEGVSDQLEARVTFDITASGAILNPRIARSSGNKEFDDSVIRAFRKMRSIGPPPTGKGDTWTVTFRMKDE